MTKKTNGDFLRADAERLGIPKRTLDQVRDCLAQAKKTNADKAMARIMLSNGRLTDEALKYVIEYADHIWQCEAYGIKR